VNPRNPNTQTIATELQTAAGALGLQLHIVNAVTEGELGEAFRRREFILLIGGAAVAWPFAARGQPYIGLVRKPSNPEYSI
jgi:hypothetical protein